jgi:tripartite-type tricarboxylate transporter receptor subunit TctC
MNNPTPPHTGQPRGGRRTVVRALLAAGAMASALMPQAAWSADFPERTIKIVVNFPPGGPLDIIARLVAARMSTTLKQAVVVDNVSGAAGNIGASQVARATPDGYTILMSIDTPFTLTPALNPTGSINTDDFRPVGVAGVTGSILAVHPSLGVDNLQALITKGRSEMLTFSTAGNGSPGHFGALMLAEAAGIKVNPIHYRGNAPAVLALVSGEVQAGVLGAGGLLPQIKAGKVKPLAVAGTSRSALLPDVATAPELGVPGLQLEFMFLAMAPAGTPDAVVSVLAKALADAVAQPDYQERMQAMDVVRSPLTGPAITAQLAQTRARYATIVKQTGMRNE